jgi:hypothetical protein
MRRLRSGIWICLAFWFMQSASLSQMSIEADVGTMLDDNVNNNSLRLSDRITTLGLQAGYDWITDATNTGLVYSGSYNYFGLVPGRTYQYHTAGVTYAQLFGEEQQTLWNAGASYGIRSDREEYAFYDHTSLSVSTSIKTPLSENLLGRTGYTFRTMRFSELDAFDYAEHVLFAQTSFFLPSRTTVIAEATMGVKLYRTPNEDSSMVSQGRGRGNSATSSPSVTQATGLVRIGQGLTGSTGLSFTGAYQINLQKEVRYLGSDYGMVSDDEIFDDHYGYEGPQASLMLTQMLPWEMQARLTGSWQRRSYASQSAYDALGTMVAADRLDTRTALNVQLHFPIEWLGCTVGLAYDHIRNTSNDAFFTYTNNAVTLQLSYP